MAWSGYRVCKECGKGEIEDVDHWLLRCKKWKTHRQPLIVMVQEHYEVDQDNLAAVILYLACRNYKVLSFISYMWHARFNELLVQYVPLGFMADLHICFFYVDVCSHVLVLHWANLVLVPSCMVHVNH